MGVCITNSIVGSVEFFETMKRGRYFYFFCILLFFSINRLSGNILSDSSAYNKDKDIHVAACPNFGAQGFGKISLGIRGVGSALFDPIPAFGLGYGGDIRIRFARRWNAELFGDYIQSNISGLGFRKMKRLGVSFLYYLIPSPFHAGQFSPFILAGGTYDYYDVFSHYEYKNRWRGWLPTFQAGWGEHYSFTPRLDATFEIFYVVPLSIHPHTSLASSNGVANYLHIVPNNDHLGGVIGIIGLNYVFGHG